MTKRNLYMININNFVSFLKNTPDMPESPGEN